MFSDPLFFFYIILGALAIVIVYFLNASNLWQHHDSKLNLKNTNTHHNLANQMSDLNLPKQQMEATVDRMVQIVNHEVQKEAQKVRAEVAQVIDKKEKEIREIKHKYEAAENNYKELGKQKTQTESVVRSIAKGVIVLDDDGKVVFLNPDAEQILGHKAQELMGKKINQVKGGHVISMVDAEGREEKAGEESSSSAREDLKGHTAVIETVHGQTRGVLSTMPTFTSDKKVEELKNEFLANVTHELRSPIICIQKSIATVREKARSEDQGYLDIAIRNAAKLEQLVNEILDLSKLESGKIHLRYEILTLHEFVRETQENFKAWAADKQIEIKIQLPQEPFTFYGDKDRLGQVLSNFTANALKFTRRGGKITMIGKVIHDRAKDTHAVEIGVQDSGPGIEEKDQANIFKKFAFINTQSTEGEKSTGLGLSIAKEIVDLHQGRIWLESKVNHGSYFAFSVPAKKATVA